MPSENHDAYKPAEIAALIETAGVAKAALPLHRMATLALLAGAFIGFGAAFWCVAMAGLAIFGWTGLRQMDWGYGATAVYSLLAPKATSNSANTSTSPVGPVTNTSSSSIKKVPNT